MCVCVCGIEPSSLVNEGGKGLSGKYLMNRHYNIQHVPAAECEP